MLIKKINALFPAEGSFLSLFHLDARQIIVSGNNLFILTVESSANQVWWVCLGVTLECDHREKQREAF